jgi:hypothetical protein
MTESFSISEQMFRSSILDVLIYLV